MACAPDTVQCTPPRQKTPFVLTSGTSHVAHGDYKSKEHETKPNQEKIEKYSNLYFIIAFTEVEVNVISDDASELSSKWKKSDFRCNISIKI